MKEMKLEDIQKNADKYAHFFQNKLEKERLIIKNIHSFKDEIADITNAVEHPFYGVEDRFYRFYHQSFKVYDLQKITTKIVDLFCKIGDCHFQELSPMFKEIVSEGIHKEFKQSSNSRWTYETRPIVEAYFHAQHILDMMIKYGLSKDPEGEISQGIEQGWGSVLHLYKIR